MSEHERARLLLEQAQSERARLLLEQAQNELHLAQATKELEREKKAYDDVVKCLSEREAEMAAMNERLAKLEQRLTKLQNNV